MSLRCEEINTNRRLPDSPGFYNMTAEVIPRAMGRVYFDGKKFCYLKADCCWGDILEHNIARYWIEQNGQI